MVIKKRVVTTQKSRVLYKGKLFSLREEGIRLPSGKFFRRETIFHPGSCAIIPLLSKKKIILIRQHRPSVRKTLWEIPAGTLERGEAPSSCARRELIEEIGYHPKKLRKITTFYTSPGFCTEKMHLYIASGLVRSSQNLEEDETIRPCSFSIAKVKKMIRRGTIQDSKTIIGLSFLPNSL